METPVMTDTPHNEPTASWELDVRLELDDDQRFDVTVETGWGRNRRSVVVQVRHIRAVLSSDDGWGRAPEPSLTYAASGLVRLKNGDVGSITWPSRFNHDDHRDLIPPAIVHRLNAALCVQGDLAARAVDDLPLYDSTARA
jgi:hypothetical protein